MLAPEDYGVLDSRLVSWETDYLQESDLGHRSGEFFWLMI